MPRSRHTARFFVALALAVLPAAALAPGALAQSDEVPPPDTTTPEDDPEGRWAASELAEPFDESARTLREETFTVAGTFRYEKAGPTDHIVGAVVRVVDDPTDDFEPREECLQPEPQVVPGREPEPGLTAELPFAVEMTVPCNGRYLVEAEATVDNPDAPSYTMRRSFVLAVLPAAVTELSVNVDAEARQATIEFTPLALDQLAPDAIGYAVERAGPATRDGSYGMYEDIATLGTDDDPRVVDDLATADGGSYSYRVRSLRDGADGPVRSSIIDTESTAISVEGAPASTSTSEVTNRPSSRGGRIVLRTPSTPRRTARPTTPTTLDTGFEDTLNYGERPPGSTSASGLDDDALAGQSIVRDEGEPMDLAAPAAGALVLLGWAGHIVYLNRLAKQL